MVCKNCGMALEEGQTTCPGCGTAVEQAATEYLGGKDKVTMALICFFLGGFGVHNFMMGETKKGIVKLVACLCCLSGILALIDFIKILMGSYTVDPEAFI